MNTSPILPRILPFLAYMGFIALAQGITWLTTSVPSLSGWTDFVNLWIYPLKTAAVIGLLIYFYPRYQELKGQPFGSFGNFILSILVGVAVYVAWVQMDWPWAMQGEPAGYNPFQAGPLSGWVLAGIRILGAAVVVPIMEELFWRSFLVRYLISSDFESIPLGAFTLKSFLLSVVLFGLEHHLWLAGMMAGAAYNFLLYKTGKLWPCIVAHGVTNLILGIHVLITKEWLWW